MVWSPNRLVTRLRRRLADLWERAILVGTTGWVRDRHPLSPDPSWLETHRTRARFAIAARERDDDALEDRHRAYWSSDDAKAWHSSREERLQTWLLRDATSFVEALEVIIGDGGLTRVVELGTGGGQVLAHFSTILPDVPTFIGVDLSPAQTRSNIERLGSDRVSFVCSDAVAYVEEQGTPGTLYFTQNGVLEYLSEASLDRLLSAARLRPPAGFALFEPVAGDMDLGREFASRPYGEESSFSHNYPSRLAEHGFSLRHVRESEFRQWRMLELVAAACSRMMCITMPLEMLLV